MYSKLLHVCIIDDGVFNDEIALFDNKQIRENNNNSFKSKKNYSHGTGCAKVVEKFLKKRFLLSSITVLDETCKGSAKSLYASFEWCVNNGVDIINLSLGSTQFNDKTDIQKAVNYCANKGIIIVAATANNDFKTFPASFSNVIGVQAGEVFDVDSKLCMNKGIDFIAPSGHKIVIDNTPIRLGKSNSFAAPYITAEIGNILVPKMMENICDVRKKVLSRFSKIGNYIYYPDWIENAWVSEKCKKSEAQYYFNTVEALFSRETQIDTLVVKDVREYKKYAETGKHIVYLGNTPVSRPEHNIHFWSQEQRNEQILKSDKRISEIDIPIIICRFDEWQDEILWLSELKSCFGEDGHNIYAVSSIIECVLYDLEYIPAKFCNRKQKDKIRDFLYWQTYYNQSDAILLSEKGQNDSFISSEDADLTLEVTGNEKKCIKIYCEGRELLEETLGLSAKDVIQYIYKKIYKLLTEDMDEQ